MQSVELEGHEIKSHSYKFLRPCNKCAVFRIVNSNKQMKSGNIPSQIVLENPLIARCTRRVDAGKVVSVKFKNPVSN